MKTVVIMSQEIFGFGAFQFIVTLDVSYYPNCTLQLISKSSLKQKQSLLPQRKVCQSNFYVTVLWILRYHRHQHRAGVDSADYSNSASS